VFAIAALCFVVQPGPVEAVTWVCAVSTVLAGTFYLTTAWFHIHYLGTRSPAPAWLAAGSFTLCLASHESSVMLLPLLYVVECVHEKRCASPGTDQHGFVFLSFCPMPPSSTGAEYVVNARNYVVTEGHYALGLHVFRNLVDYVVALHVGQHTTAVRIAVVAASALLLAVVQAASGLYALDPSRWCPSPFTGQMSRVTHSPQLASRCSSPRSRSPMACPARRQRRRRRRCSADDGGRSDPASFAHKRVQTFQRAVEPYRTFAGVPTGASRLTIWPHRHRHSDSPACRRYSRPPSGLSTTTPNRSHAVDAET
jgi:hypothetical protein